jgi:dihydrolipoamide dehydrogenase
MNHAIIIGAGPAGFYAALEIARLGGKAVIIEKDLPGGTCTNHGCMPMKTLHSYARLRDRMASASKKEIIESLPHFTFEKVFEQKERVTRKSREGIESRLKNAGVPLIKADARITGPGTVDAGDQTIEARSILIATGSVPSIPFSLAQAVTTNDILDSRDLSESVLIAGGGVIGCELAFILSSFGSKVAIAECLPRLLHGFDTDVSAEIERIAKSRGIRVILDACVSAEGASLLVNGKEEIAKTIVIAAGRSPSLDAETCDTLGIARNDRGIVVDSRMRTSVRGIYAAGDVTDSLKLAYVARYEGEIAARNIMGKTEKADFTLIPRCCQTNPPAASVGLTEQSLDYPELYTITKYPFASNSMAQCSDALSGFLKIIAKEKNGRIVGIHMVGDGAEELVTFARSIIANKMTLAQLARYIIPHPSLSEVFMDAAAKRIE